MPPHDDLQDVEFLNSEQRCPCVLLLDTSGSMTGAPIAALNEGLRIFAETLKQDDLASLRVEVAVVTFASEVNVVSEFATADLFEPPTLFASGLTCMGSGICQALDMLRDRKEAYRRNGIKFYRPWLFMITDGEPAGEPEDMVRAAAQRVREEEANKRVAFFAVGVEGANMQQLATFSAVREPVKLAGLNFQKMFQWLSSSLTSVSQSKLDEEVRLLPPKGWASV